tara:strand:- start:2091 stop:3026 length:936 start_codon:yes stop_codon:yes gene_type:complete
MISKIKNYIFKRYFKKYQIEKKIMIGHSHFLNMRGKYADLKKLSNVDYKVFSQNGEDGIIDYLIRQINIDKPKFIEIGVGDYSESNTKFIFETTSAHGMIVDCLKNFKEKVKENTKIWKGQLEIIEQQVNSKNIINLINSKHFFENLDIFSLDIDGIDYWIIKELPKNFSKIAIIEYNPIFGIEKHVTVPNLDNFNRTDYHYSNLCFGMSLRAAIEIMKEKNFYFVGVNLMRNNAFFVSNIFPKDEYFRNLQVDNFEEIDNANFQESRDKNNNLNYLGGKKKIQEIYECEVVKLDNNNYKKIKIKDLYNIK